MLNLKIVEQDSLNGECRHNFPLSDFFSFDIRPYTSVVKFERGENILEEGRQVSYLYYLAGGRAKLFLSHENGRISLINFLNAPCFIGEMELIGAQSVSSGVTAITPASVTGSMYRSAKTPYSAIRNFSAASASFSAKRRSQIPMSTLKTSPIRWKTVSPALSY